jgi:rod shape determining protein RodA
LIVKQPDLGTALSLAPVFVATLYVAGAKSKHLTWVLVAALVALGLYTAVGLHGYQNERVQVWWKQDSLTRTEKLAEGYHLHRSKIAIGSGGVFGYGFAEGPQNKNDLLPERHTDFVFSVFSEEWGFVGASLLLALELALPVGLLWLSMRVRDPFARNAIVAIGAQVGAQALVNMGVATGTFPTTGISLPLVSHGGSSVIVTLVSLTIALMLAAKAEPSLAADAFEEEEERTWLYRRRR